MTSRLAAPFALGLLALGGLGCGPALKLPAGVTCSRTVLAGPSAASLQDALARATPGTCVVAAPGRYPVALSVPAGVILAGAVGGAVELAGEAGPAAALTLAAGATLSTVQVVDPPGVGVAVVGPRVTLFDVTVQGAPSAGVVFWCEEDCLGGDGSSMQHVDALGNGVGLLVHAARVQVVGGRVAQSQSQHLAAGYGVVASHGSVLSMSGTVVEDNEALGLLVDGALDTEATLEAVTVRNNLGWGVWAQGLTGSALAPRLQLTDCTVEGNRLAGLGARASRGIVVSRGRVAATVESQTLSETPGVLVTVGDGIGLFAFTGDVRVEGVALDRNQRSQVLIDHGSTGLVIDPSSVTTQPGQLGVVVQQTAEAVQSSTAITTPAAGQELPISSIGVVLPSP